MREMIISELSQALHAMARGFAHFLPRLIVMLIVAICRLGGRVRGKSGSAQHSEAGQVRQAFRKCWRLSIARQGRAASATEMLSRFVFWVAWLGFILLGVSVLGILGLQEQVADFFFSCRVYS